MSSNASSDGETIDGADDAAERVEDPSKEADDAPDAADDAPDAAGDADRPPTSYEREALAEDLRQLVTAIESVHADPYRGYDGRVDLHRRLETTVEELPDEATVEEFYRHAAPLVAGLADSHSRLCPPEADDIEDRRLPLSLRVVGEELYVESVADDSLRPLLGGRLVSVDGVGVDVLRDRGSSLRSAENRYTVGLFAAGQIESYEWLARVLDRPEPPANPEICVAVDGEERRHRVPPVPEDAEPTAELDPTVTVPTGSGPRFDRYEDGEAAVFVPGDLMGYREVIEAARARDAEYTETVANEAYESHVGGTPPADLDALVAVLPSMIESLTALVRELAAQDTETLIVDLRDNPGGDSRYVQYLAYVLWGWTGVLEAVESATAVKRRTEAHQDRYGVPEHATDEFATAARNPADYDFGHAFRSRDGDRQSRLERIREQLNAGSVATELESGLHEGYYRPERVIVATTAGTMSSGFAGAAMLSTLGAEVVGVPSGQAPISFGEPVEERLANTGLPVEIAGSMYRWVPDPEGDVLAMDRELTPELFERYDRAGDAVLRLAFDHAGVTEPGAVPDPI